MVDKFMVALEAPFGLSHTDRERFLGWANSLASKLRLGSPIIVPQPVPPGRVSLPPVRLARELRALLAETVEAEVVPRLLLRRRDAVVDRQGSWIDEEPEAEPEVGPDPEDVVALVALVMTSEADDVLCFVDVMRARGVPLDRLYLELLAPAARRLGQLWAEDLCSFTDVTMGLGRLQQVLREMSPAFIPAPGLPDRRRRAALVPVPGEQHSFGLAMVTEFFLRAGWDVWSQPQANAEALAGLVGGQWFAVLGLSLSCDSSLPEMPGLIRTLRRASLNPRLGIMVGGRVFVEQPELAMQIGADATAADGRQAALQAETLLALHGMRLAQ
ncbi:cobalamin-dependent protein [Belnapia sp. T6]|uniref:Cobalamin-dependent protein n=1 Tax=Belnapia mucosa TaxID=2804532 RepID=A0ABS1V1R0_9PROT|nr:cobalamin-dependent protein [Belnapia mucosa]MBL6455643.1 cobalamin-dependent protein [Belnapia mucosa]